jgi:hypothetical protein
MTVAAQTVVSALWPIESSSPFAYWLFFFGWTVGFEQILLQENGDLFVRSNPGSGF